MVNSRLLTGRKSPFVLLGMLLVLSVVFCTGAFGAAKDGDVGAVIAEVIQSQVDVGEKAYARGLYAQAEQAFAQAASQAAEYQEYLSADVIVRIKGLHAKAKKAVTERTIILRHIETANKLIKDRQLLAARRELEQITDSEFLTKKEKGQIALSLSKLNSQLGKPGDIGLVKPRDTEPDNARAAMTALYKRSVELYAAGELVKARAGFVKVAQSGLVTAPAGKRPEDFIAKIDSPAKSVEPAIVEPVISARVPDSWVADRTAVSVPRVPSPVSREPAAVSNGADESYMQKVIRERNVRRDHARTVVADANETAVKYMEQGKFENAQYEVDGAREIVNQYQLDLGDDRYKAYSLKLKLLSDEIGQRKAIRDAMLAKEKADAAIEAQKKYIADTEARRAKSIKGLLATAKEYVREQRYEEACGQLKDLLKIDPLHDEALILKELLEDTISFREETRVTRASRKARAKLLTEVEGSAIPLPDELTYSTDWKGIVEKREPEEVIGDDPRDMAVYKQLDEVINLADLDPQMPFADALDLLRSSVEPPLKIVVLWRDLVDNADIEQTTPINISPISMAPLGTVLELLLKGVSAGGYSELGYVVQKGVITVATEESLPSKLVTRVYDVSVLLGQPSQRWLRRRWLRRRWLRRRWLRRRWLRRLWWWRLWWWRLWWRRLWRLRWWRHDGWWLRW